MGHRGIPHPNLQECHPGDQTPSSQIDRNDMSRSTPLP